MRKVYYIYNPKTRTYDRVYPTFRQRVLHVLKRLFVGMGFGAGSFILLLWIFGSPSEKQLRIENSRLLAQYNVLSRRLDEALGVMQGIQQRDDNLYRVVVNADPVPSEAREIDKTSVKYKDLREKTSSDIATLTTQKVDELRRKLYVQSKSFNEVFDAAKNHEERLLRTPSIQPVLNKDMKRMASGYGMRIDPIYKTPKFHAGMDFSGAHRSEIFATAKGTLTFVGWKQGYGNCMIIDHGFGYETLYAHLDGFKLKRGQQVNRGDVIGYMGNTGKSTGTHLHYEVHYKGKVTDPRNYYFQDLNPEEYDEMVRLTSNNGNVFD
jgi:murein DD-endopeptidase MepM/ murein hydrolase activator NlpD